MSTNPFPTINGVIHSSAECSITMAMYGGGKPFRTSDVTDFSFEETLEPADVAVLGGRKIGTTEGVYNATGSISLLLKGHVELKEVMAKTAKAQRIKLGAVTFSVQGSYRPTANSPLVRFVASGCRMTGVSLEGTSDAGAIVVATPLNIMQLRINGRSLGEVPS